MSYLTGLPALSLTLFVLIQTTVAQTNVEAPSLIADQTLINQQILKLLQNSVLGNDVAFDPLNSLSEGGTNTQEPAPFNSSKTSWTSSSIKNAVIAASGGRPQRKRRQSSDSRVFLVLRQNQRKQLEPRQLLQSARNNSVLILRRRPSTKGPNKTATADTTVGRRIKVNPIPTRSRTTSRIRPRVVQQNNLRGTLSRSRSGQQVQQQQQQQQQQRQQSTLGTSQQGNTARRRLPNQRLISVGNSGSRLLNQLTQNVGQIGARQSRAQTRPQVQRGTNRATLRTRVTAQRQGPRRPRVNDPFQQRFSAGFSFGDRLLIQPPMDFTGFDGTRRQGGNIGRIQDFGFTNMFGF